MKIDLNHKSNKVYIIGHKGRHTNAYHDMVEKATKTIMSKYDDVNNFYKEIENLGKLIKEKNVI